MTDNAELREKCKERDELFSAVAEAPTRVSGLAWKSLEVFSSGRGSIFTRTNKNNNRVSRARAQAQASRRRSSSQLALRISSSWVETAFF